MDDPREVLETRNSEWEEWTFLPFSKKRTPTALLTPSEGHNMQVGDGREPDTTTGRGSKVGVSPLGLDYFRWVHPSTR